MQGQSEKSRRYTQLRDSGKSHEEAVATVEQEFSAPQNTTPEEAPHKSNMAVGMAREAASGLLPGIASRIEAGVRAIGPETYRGSLDKILEERKQFQGEHPIAAMGSSVVGGLPLMFVPGVGAGKAVQQATLAQKVLSAAGTGAKAGAIYGGLESSYNEDPREIAGGAISGGLAGGLTGSVFAGAASPVVKTARAIQNRGQDAVQKIAGSRGAERLLEIVAEARGRTPEKMSKVLQRAAGAGTKEDPRIVADLAPELAATLRGVRSASPETNRAVTNRIVRARSGKSGERTLNKLAEAMSIAPEDALEKADDIVTRRAAEALKGYADAFSAGEVSDDATLNLYRKLQDLFPEAKAAGHESQKLAYGAQGRAMPQVDKVAQQIAQAVEDMKAAGLSTPKHFMAGISQMFPKATPAQIAEGLAGAKPKPPTVEELHFFKQGVDRVIRSKGQRAEGKVPLAATDERNAIDLQQQFLAALDNAVPEYGKARANFADESALLNALEQGREMYRRPGANSAREVGREAKALSAAEQDMMRLGGFDAAKENLLQSGIGDEGLRNLFGAKLGTGQISRPDRLQKMLELIPENQRHNFEKYLRQELAGAETSSLMGGSQTAEKIREGMAVEGSAPGFSSALQGNPTRIVGDEIEAALRRTMKGMKKEDADKMGEILLTPLSNSDAAQFFAEIAKARRARQSDTFIGQKAPSWLGGMIAGSRQR